MNNKNPQIIKGIFKELAGGAKHILSDLNDAVNTDDEFYPSNAEIPAFLSENNIKSSELAQTMLTSELSSNQADATYLDIDISEDIDEKQIKVRGIENVGDAKIVIIRVKALMAQLRDKAGITFRLHIPKD
tara:strand:- start:104 stop:496 length:393 start_codon:yes stop_codon:yes gene_type:complete